MKVEEWEKLDDNYSMMATPIREDTNERWVLIFSKDAYDRDVKTLNKNLVKKEKLIKKAVAKMEKEIFHCEKDASKAIAKLGKDHPLFNLWPIEMIPIYAEKDKNKKGIPKQLLGYGLKIGITKEKGAITKLKDECGKFILGTNVSKDKLPDDKILGTYKEQSKVESCFRFLKNPSFFASDIYLKKVGRIEALMLVVTLAIMTYNVMEFFIREMLKETGKTFPNQVGKKINNPTLRWVFQCFKSINISSTGEVTNMRMHLAIIVSFFGEDTMALYGIRGHPPVCKLVLK
jgi:transposase